jgi:predicted phosphodiesterase
MTKSELARKYRKENPDMPTHKLARIMYNENNLLFAKVESARDSLRLIEGKRGGRKYKTNNEFIREEARPMNPYKLPETEATLIKPYPIKNHKRAFIINDVHLPYHDIDAITIAFDYAKKENPDVVILNGDIIDCFKLSRFVKDPKARDFAYELGQFKEFFQIIQKTFTKAEIVYKFGNHEVRYDHFLYEKAKELVGVKEFELSEIIKARANGIKIVKSEQIIKLNELDLLHGHEFQTGFFNPVNVARGLYLRAKVTSMQGHSHKSSEHSETDLHRKIKTTWSVGCLCGLQPQYAPYNSWNHGFALVDLDTNKKDFEVRNKRIYQGKVY